MFPCQIGEAVRRLPRRGKQLVGFGAGTLLGDLWCQCSTRARWQATPGALATVLVITTLATVAASFFFYSRAKAEHLQRHMAQAQHEATQARLKLLEAQLEPHMLFNTLANLRVLIGIDPVRAQTMLDHMIAYLRATLAASRATSHPLQAEFDRLRDYLELMSIRMGPRLRYSLDLPPDLASNPVPTLLLQPLVENAIKHGLEPKVEGGSVTVTARRENGQIVLEVADTGVGLAPAPAGGPANAAGFGVGQVRERLATLYGDAASLTLQRADDDAGGARVGGALHDHGEVHQPDQRFGDDGLQSGLDDELTRGSVLRRVRPGGGRRSSPSRRATSIASPSRYAVSAVAPLTWAATLLADGWSDTGVAVVLVAALVGVTALATWVRSRSVAG